MKTSILFSVLLIALVPVLLLGQTVYPVVAGTDQIGAALAIAPPGSIIELTTSGGLYKETVTAVIDRALTIRAAAGLAEKPIWVCDRAGIQIEVFDDLTLEGISFDGALGDSLTEACVRAGEVDVKPLFNLMVDNCDFKNYWDEVNDAGWAIYGDGGATTQADKAYITNCTFTHIFRETIRFKDGEIAPGAVLDFKVEHCTFWDIGDEAIYGEDHDNNIETPAGAFLVNHVTIYKTNTAGGKNIYPKVMDGAIIKNSIVSNSADRACKIYGPNSAVQWFLYYMCALGTIDVSSGATVAQLTDILADVDPMFADPENGDFTLDASSPAVGAGEGGATLGDKRWWPTGTAVEGNNETLVLTGFQLKQNYPNPFNPITKIVYSIPNNDHVELTVYDLMGKKITTLVSEIQTAGVYTVTWNATDGRGMKVPSGVYFYKIQTGESTLTNKMLLMK